jgi:MscS family membrane protein
MVLGKELFPDLEALSVNPKGDPNDGLAEGRDRIGRITGETKIYDLLLERVPREDGVSIWKVASATVAQVPKLHEEFGYGRLETILPPWFFDYRVIGIEIVWWVALVIVGAAGFPVAMLLAAGVLWLLRRFRPDAPPELEQFFTGPVRLLLWVLLGRFLMQTLHTSVVLRAFGEAKTLLVVALAWMVLRALDLAGQRIADRLESAGLGGAKMFLRPVTRLAKLVTLVGALLLWLENLGYEVTTLLAGLSISGVAVALASQKTLENVFGALTLYTAQPVRQGDFCRFGDQIGTVEEIGLRATLIRTLDRSLISVPNAEFATMHLDNLSRRDRFWYHPRLKLRPETTPDQIRFVLVEVRKMLYAHPKVLPEPLWVRFTEFGDCSRDLDVFAYIGVTDWFESLEVAEDLHLRILDIVAQAGTELAIPSQIQYGNPAKEMDQDRARTAESKVNEWRSQQSLYLPNFPADTITELTGTLQYPSAGSPELPKHRSHVS